MLSKVWFINTSNGSSSTSAGEKIPGRLRMTGRYEMKTMQLLSPKSSRKRFYISHPWPVTIISRLDVESQREQLGKVTQQLSCDPQHQMDLHLLTKNNQAKRYIHVPGPWRISVMQVKKKKEKKNREQSKIRIFKTLCAGFDGNLRLII